ncbi:DUF6881 domain-containing protein [Tenacibaculum maritimum]|uniref:DUF6881 domain-containing protein n=1 Tax=Tenacibaculum maritimum TaxID=107401 RepID=UPI0012E6B3D3|nr:hypothetical protein [Tenacibaculum maritimum]CAA0219004.1 conserved hypothetical protein [Tenacibaculum maritimum]CAA0221551.1 conserved hypothetical protein [Tenacibaculum maritimum]CAA0224683.1 conserved hypothetical protein [Tenacibaculum maritimum]
MQSKINVNKVKHYKIDWIHKWNDEYPYCYYIEVDSNNYEVKKLEKYQDGRVYYATDKEEKDTFLFPEPFYLKDYNSEDENEIIKCVEISKEEFNKEWTNKPDWVIR